MPHKKVPTYLTDEQCQIMMEISTDLDDRDLARYYTLTPEELELVNHRRSANRFGFRGPSHGGSAFSLRIAEHHCCGRTIKSGQDHSISFGKRTSSCTSGFCRKKERWRFPLLLSVRFARLRHAAQRG